MALKRDEPSKRGVKTVMATSLSAVMAALVCAATMILSYPIPATGGYINLGDTMILLSALLFGELVGGFAGGVGSALADLLLGYGSWAPFTLVIKGLEGLIAGRISTGRSSFRDTVAVALAGAEMVLGYFIVQVHLYGFGPALTELPGNIFQASFGVAIAVPVSFTLRRSFPRLIAVREALTGRAKKA